MKVSIITATFNSLPYIKETYDSIRSQTFSNWEWLVTDDCSSDGTFEYINQLASEDRRIIVRRNAVNSGAAVSRNVSLSNSDGDYIAFIDSDDIWLPEKLQYQLEFMELNNLDFTFTSYETIDESSLPHNRFIDLNQTEPVDYKDMLKKKATLGCSTVILRRSAIRDLSMPLLRTGQDYALWLKILKQGIKAYPCNKILMKYRIVPTSISRNKFRKAARQWQIYRKIERLSFVDACLCFAFYAWRAVFRR